MYDLFIFHTEQETERFSKCLFQTEFIICIKINADQVAVCLCVLLLPVVFIIV